MLLDRLPERAALNELLDAARAGRSGVLVMRGEPGIGKTALLEYAIEAAGGLRVARVAGVESEMELAFAALQQLCAPMLGQLAALPDPQRDALGAATFAGRLALGGGMREVAEAARMAPPPPGPRADPTCCWTAWRSWSRKATRRGRRCSARR